MKRPIVSLIAACNNRRAIGRDNALLWSLPCDMRHFRQTTLGKPVVMGRATYESIGRLLPKRTNVILSRRADFAVEGAIVVRSAEEALCAAGDVGEIMIIGGAQIYSEFLPRAHRIYLTHVDNDLEGDAYFPHFDARVFFEASSVSSAPDADNAYGCRFVTYERASVR